MKDVPFVDRGISWIVRFRVWIIIGIHIFLFGLSYACAFLLLKEKGGEVDPAGLFQQTLFALLIVRLIAFWRYDLYDGLWRYVSFQDLLNILRAVFISSASLVGAGLIWKPLSVPESVYILDGVFCIVLVGGVRCFIRNLRENFLPGTLQREMRNIVVLGPVKSVQPFVKELIEDPHCPYYPLAIVDPTKPFNTGITRVLDLPIFSLQGILKRKHRLPRLEAAVLCWPDATREQLDNLVESLQSLGAPFKTVPPIEDFLSGRIRFSDIRDVEIEDLLERPPVRIEMDCIRRQLQGRVILVTGGGGSIGSELCRQIAAFEPRLLIVVERSENSLYQLHLELKSLFPKLPLYASISSINDYQGLRILMRKMKVEVVFHAAAYKHVPLMEAAPVESAYNNVLGTWNLAQAAFEAGVGRFVMISTDKAVNPTNVMGVTKRIAEMVIQSYNGNGHTHTKFMVVRFGNVMGSAGSVIPIFRKQMAEGQPVTVTHRDIERFFMTIPEAVQLVLQAGSMGNGGEIFVLDMGKPLKVLHLAEKLITLSGKRPYSDVEIVFTGLRPGEKMYEELFNHCEIETRTSHDQIMVAVSGNENHDLMKMHIEEIRQMVLHHEEEALRRKFKELVPGYCSLPGLATDVEAVENRERRHSHENPEPLVSDPLQSGTGQFGNRVDFHHQLR